MKMTHETHNDLFDCGSDPAIALDFRWMTYISSTDKLDFRILTEGLTFLSVV